ncbi:MAG: hypothetical protein H7Z13_18875 [Ferruginibacter sp.]|nr:hypothetical protein [Ferruginibacter sp.]
MKKQFVLMVFAAIFSFTSVNAQGGGGQRQTPEEMTKTTMEKLAVLNLDADAKTKTETVIADFNKAQTKAREEMRAAGTMDREAMMAKRKELADARDAKLKVIFTPEQMKKWIDEIEPSLRPQRGNAPRPANK